MKEILFWTGAIGLQLLIYFLPSTPLSKGKWIRHKSTVRLPTYGLSDSVDPMAAMPQIKIKGADQLKKYPIQAEIGKETWYIEVHGDTPDQAIEEGRWSIKRIANVPINQVLNARIEKIENLVKL